MPGKCEYWKVVEPSPAKDRRHKSRATARIEFAYEPGKTGAGNPRFAAEVCRYHMRLMGRYVNVLHVNELAPSVRRE